VENEAAGIEKKINHGVILKQGDKFSLNISRLLAQ
jgi:hypothetical protein